jgi:nucleoside-diphosphate-sugar epimerase
MMRSISILGCGWLGKALAKSFLDQRYQILGSTTRKENLEELKNIGVKPFLVQFSPHPQGDRLHEFFQSEILIISIPPKRKSGQSEMFLMQMGAVLNEVLRGKISNVLFISSTSVYRELNRIVTEEDSEELSPLVQAENLFRNRSEFDTTIVRFGGLAGPGRHPGNFLAGKKDLPGGNSPVNIIHQYDCIEIIKEIIRQQKWNQIFNACANGHPTRKEFYTKASKDINLMPPEFLPTTDVAFKIVSTKKLAEELSYKYLYPDPMTWVIKK